MAQPPARRRSPGKKALDPKALEERYKALTKAAKDEQKAEADEAKRKAKEIQQHQQTLSRQKRGAERDRTKREKEADRIKSTLTKVQRESQNKSGRQVALIEKIEGTISKLAEDQKSLEAQLEAKVAEAAQAKGQLAHIEFARSLMEKATHGGLSTDVVSARGDGLDQSELFPQRPAIANAEHHAEESPSPASPTSVGELEAASAEAAYEQELFTQAEELKSSNERMVEANTELRAQVECLRLVVENQRAARSRAATS